MFVAVDPKLDAEALAAKGARFAAPKAILTESNAETLAPLFTEETELVILPDGTAFLDDDLELSASALRRNGDRLYVMGDVTIPERQGSCWRRSSICTQRERSSCPIRWKRPSMSSLNLNIRSFVSCTDTPLSASRCSG